jgi:signal transduction histidine kinase
VTASVDATMLLGVVLASVLAAGVLGLGLRWAHRRIGSLRWTLLLMPVAAVAVATAVVAASTRAMVLTEAESQLVLVALLFGAVLGVGLAVAVSGPLIADLRELAGTARRVAAGDLVVGPGPTRRDEVGALAASLEDMVRQLAALEAQRERDGRARAELFTAIGHDLRTPLASLQAAVEALQDGVASDPDRYLRAMATDVTSLRALVDDLFVLTRLDAGAFELDRVAIDLSELADGAVEAVAALAARRDVEVVVTPDGGPATVDADPRALDRVLRNLLDNAIRHAPAGSVVRVSVLTDGTEATVRVHDDGAGFPDGFAGQAFEPFSRADAARARDGSGAGLGLAIARELVVAHGGRIWIDDGPGATVGFALAVRDADAVRVTGRRAQRDG